MLRKNGILLVALAVLIIIKIVLAMVTPPSDPVIYYLQVQSLTRSTASSNPWGRFDNATLSAWYALPIDHPGLQTFLTHTSLFLPLSLELLLLLVKLPLILADLFIAFVLFRLGKCLWPSTDRPVVASLLWLANPYATFVTEMMGAVDVIPVASITLAMFLVLKRRHVLGAVSLAAGIAVKLFPIVAVPTVLYSGFMDGSKRVKVVLSGVLALCGLFAYVAWSGFPFSQAYYTQSTTEFILGLQSLYGLGTSIDFIGLATFSVVISYLLAYEFRTEMFHKPETLFLFVLLGYLAFLDFRIEYLLWLIPLFILANLTDRRTIPLFVCILVTGFTTGFFISDGYTTTSGWTLLFFNRSSEWATIILSSQFIDLVLRPLLRTFLAAFMILTMFLLWGSNIESKPQNARLEQSVSP